MIEKEIIKEIVEKLRRKEVEIANQKGSFHLFALFLRKDSWDLLVAAPWIDQDKSGALKYMTSEVQQILDKKELLIMSKVVIIDNTSPALDVTDRIVNIEHGSAEFQDSSFFGLKVKHAYFITSKRVKKT
jgi:hypothetical protein